MSDEKSPLEEAADEIAILCGCPEWDYPMQLVRDVQAVVKQRDEALAELTKLRLEIERLKVET